MKIINNQCGEAVERTETGSSCGQQAFYCGCLLFQSMPLKTQDALLPDRCAALDLRLRPFLAKQPKQEQREVPAAQPRKGRYGSEV